MILNTKEIADGKKNGKIVYICDIRHNGNPFENFIRNVKPTEVMIMSNDTLPKNKRIYYSASHFVKLKKDKSPSKTVIGLFDNTGYRAFTGVALNCFDDLKECEDRYKKQKKTIIDDMKKQIEILNNQIKDFEEKE